MIVCQSDLPLTDSPGPIDIEKLAAGKVVLTNPLHLHGMNFICKVNSGAVWQDKVYEHVGLNRTGHRTDV